MGNGGPVRRLVGGDVGVRGGRGSAGAVVVVCGGGCGGSRGAVIAGAVALAGGGGIVSAGAVVSVGAVVGAGAVVGGDVFGGDVFVAIGEGAVAGLVPGIVACAGQGQQEEQPKESPAPPIVLGGEDVGRVGVWIFFQGSGHPVPVGTVCPQRVVIGRPPEKIVN